MAYHGKDGSLAFNGSLVNIDGWSLETTAEISESTSFGDTWDKYNGGLTDFTGSAEGNSKKALNTVALLGTGATIVFGLNNSNSPAFSAAAIITSITETVGINGNGRLSWGFEGNDTAGLVFGSGTAAAFAVSSFHGKHSKALIVATPITDFREWSISMVCATADVTPVHATLSGRLRVAGLKSATATITALATSADIQFVYGTVYVMSFYRTQTITDGYYKGSFILTGHSIGLNTQSEATITYNLQQVSKDVDPGDPGYALELKTS